LKPISSSRLAVVARAAIPAAMILAGLAPLSASAEGQGNAAKSDAYSVMSSDARLTDWTKLLKEAALDRYARGDRPFTMFAVSDADFKNAPAAITALLQELTKGNGTDKVVFPDTSKVPAFVRSHVVTGKVEPGEIMGKTLKLTNLAGQTIEIDGTSKPARISWQSVVDGQKRTATLSVQPINCQNAVIYVLGNISKA
jgi:uncharacterized surface protein with fasciclin (FAS1) repeats